MSFHLTRRADVSEYDQGMPQSHIDPRNCKEGTQNTSSHITSRKQPIPKQTAPITHPPKT